MQHYIPTCFRQNVSLTTRMGGIISRALSSGAGENRSHASDVDRDGIAVLAPAIVELSWR